MRKQIISSADSATMTMTKEQLKPDQYIFGVLAPSIVSSFYNRSQIILDNFGALENADAAVFIPYPQGWLVRAGGGRRGREAAAGAACD